MIPVVDESLCGRGRFIEQGAERWWVTCDEQLDHEGPHVGWLGWYEDAESVDIDGNTE